MKTINEDMTVYKLVRLENRNIVHSYFYLFTWTPNVLEKTKMIITMCNFNDIPSYHDLQSLVKFKSDETVSVISEGFHAAKSIKRLNAGDKNVGIFTIPAGSETYEDYSGLIVSNQIIFTKLFKC